MKSGREVQMKELLDAAPVRDLVPDFDQEGLWTELAAALPTQQPRSRILLRRMVAAAALLLVLIGGGWIFFLASPDHTNKQLATVKTQAVNSIAAGTSAARRTVASPPATAIPAPKLRLAGYPTHVSAVNIIAAPVQVARVATAPLATTAPVAINPPAIAATPAPKKVTHYLDLDDATASPAVAEADHASAHPGAAE